MSQINSAAYTGPDPIFLGYTEERNLPIRRGMLVTIPKGTPISYRGVKVVKRTYKVRVHSICTGSSDIHHKDADGKYEPISNPKVTWVGTGGYWADADMNFIPEARKLRIFL
jgi:hypothetical protein